MWKFKFLTGDREYLTFKYFCFGVLLILLRKAKRSSKTSGDKT
jgi:hypothetical protein